MPDSAEAPVINLLPGVNVSPVSPGARADGRMISGVWDTDLVVIMARSQADANVKAYADLLGVSLRHDEPSRRFGFGSGLPWEQAPRAG